MKLSSSILVYTCLADDRHEEPGLLDSLMGTLTANGQWREKSKKLKAAPKQKSKVIGKSKKVAKKAVKKSKKGMKGVARKINARIRMTSINSRVL